MADMAPATSAAFEALMTQGAQRHQLQTYTDHGVLERMLIQGGDPSNYADLQTGSHVPTPQPWVVPNFIQPNGKPVGT